VDKDAGKAASAADVDKEAGMAASGSGRRGQVAKLLRRQGSWQGSLRRKQ